MKGLASVIVTLSVTALTAAGQRPTGVNGRVLADDTGDPIPNARVILSSPSQGTPVLTDRDGRFTLALSSYPARVTVAASKTGYGPREVTASVGQPIEVRLARGAAISGRVVDAHGDPVLGARVIAETAATATGAPIPGAAAALTDDRGEYRLGSLPADAFKVAVLSMSEPTRQVGPGGNFTIRSSPIKTYFPDASTAEAAQPLRLGPGEDRSSIDFTVPFGQPGMAVQLLMLPPRVGSPSSQAVRPSGIVRGRVVATDGRAIPRAEVRLTPMPSGGLTPGATRPVMVSQPALVTADDNGRFEFTEVAAGSFRLAAAKMGYSLPGEPVSFASPLMTSGLAIDLAEGQTRERADITLARWGALAGRVVDELGDLIQGVSVQLLQVRYQAGRRRLVAAGGASRVSDDLGRYRTYGIAPGQYIVSATIGDVAAADVPGYARSYFPGTLNGADAQFVSIGVAQEVTSIDLSLARTRTALVSGVLLDESGTPSTQGSVRLVTSQRAASATSVSIGARLSSNGKFEFPNVAPGQYVILVDRGRRGSSAEGEFGSLPVAVDGTDITDLRLQTSAGSSIAGRIIFDSYLGAKLPRTGAIEIVPMVVDPEQSTASPASASIHDDWRFEMTGVSGPRRLQAIRTPADWALEAIRLRGVDVTDRPIAFGRADQSVADVEVVLTDRINELSGTIADDHARPVPDARLIVFAIDRDRWYPASRYLRAAAVNADGTFTMAGLPVGSYYAVAVTKLPNDGDDAWQDPAYLESLLPRAVTFTLGEGQRQALSLKMP
jgi:hypothetical protein